MINLALLRQNPEFVRQLINKKDPDYPVQRLIELDAEVRRLRTQIEELRAEKNELARQAKGGVSDEVRQRSRNIGKRLKESEASFQEVEKEFRDLYLRAPNLPDEDVPEGDESANYEYKRWGEKPAFSFTPKGHVELARQTGWVDFEAAARMSGSHFALYRGDGARLLWTLGMFMFQRAMEHGYTPVAPPYLVNERALEGASNFPRFKEDIYPVDNESAYLTPTAEVNLAALYRDTILAEADLPLRTTAFTSCFRREAGGYGATERGLMRLHQFEKVELFSVAHPDYSSVEQQRMLACAESLLQDLGLHYRVVLLAGQDASFPSAKTYDIEVWMPFQEEYREVSSVSNCTDFQSRRSAIRYRPSDGGSPELVHTLNGSSLALPRLMIALMETYQTSEGGIVLPEVLREVSLGF